MKRKREIVMSGLHINNVNLNAPQQGVKKSGKCELENVSLFDSKFTNVEINDHLQNGLFNEPQISYDEFKATVLGRNKKTAATKTQSAAAQKKPQQKTDAAKRETPKKTYKTKSQNLDEYIKKNGLDGLGTLEQPKKKQKASAGSSTAADKAETAKDKTSNKSAKSKKKFWTPGGIPSTRIMRKNG